MLNASSGDGDALAVTQEKQLSGAARKKAAAGAFSNCGRRVNSVF
jgi:hypothetical protein